jgi:hypothetical protein
VVDQLLGGLFGGQDDDDDEGRRRRATDFVDRYERGAPYDGINDDEVIQNYRATAGRLSPQEYEEATAESLGRLSREERRELRRRLRQQQRGGQFNDDDDDDPRTMARELSQYRQQGSDDPLGGLLGGLGGMLGGGGGSQGSSQGGGGAIGETLGGPLGKALMGGVAAFAMKKMMGGR